MRRTAWLVVATVLLTGAGVLLYQHGDPAWAQLTWVMASGTAGAAVMSWLDR